MEKLGHFIELTEILRRLPLGEDKYIGIYGVGVHTERLLRAYQARIGAIKPLSL